MAKLLFFSITALGFFCNITFAFGPIPLQDLCVADPTSSTRLNGLPCKDPATVKAEDFFFSGLHIPGNTKNPYGAALTSMTVAQVPGLNTLGLSLARLDLAPDGFVPPHSHPRATEIPVLEGSLEVGFITSYPDNKHLSKVLNQGDAFVIPVGLVHYQRNVAGKRNTVVLAAVNSQNAGITVVPKGIFGAKPAINSDYLARAFLLNKNIVEQLQARF